MNGFALAMMMAAGGVAAGLPPMPPDAPQRGEIVVDGARDPVAIRCAGDFSKVRKSQNSTLHRVIVTTDAKWGTIWRADSSVPMGHGDPPMWWRTVCWNKGYLERPLEMFDPSQSIQRLK